MEEERMARDEASLGRVVGDLVREVGTLVSREVELARCELAQKAGKAKRGAGWLGAGAAAAWIGGVAVCAGLVLGLTLLLREGMGTLAAACVSSLIVGFGAVAAGYGLYRFAVRKMSPAELVPRRTVEAIKEDARWARTRL